MVRQTPYWLRAPAVLHEALVLSRDIGARELITDILENLARLAVMHGRAPRAARLSGATEALREALNVPLAPDQRADHTRAVQAMRAALGEAAFAAAWVEGRALPLEAAIALALESHCETVQGQ
jgi:hypothetical protein